MNKDIIREFKHGELERLSKILGDTYMGLTVPKSDTYSKVFVFQILPQI